MNQEQIATIVNLVSASDGRNKDPQLYGAWFLVIGHLDFDLAKEATLEAMRDDTIRWVEPKHVLGKVSRIRDRHDANLRREQALLGSVPVVYSPPPVCVHGLSLLKCKPCGDVLADSWVCAAHSEVFVKCAVCHGDVKALGLLDGVSKTF